MFWLAAICAVGVLITLIGRLFVKETDYYVKASEVKEIEMRSRSV